jgi:cob(I)alamin adenosyltransferase
MEKTKKRGLIIVYTGSGKGKTTAALGMALRGIGHDFRILIIQFIKGSWKYGELEAAKRLHPYLKIMPMGRGFIHFNKEGATPEDIKAVVGAWEIFKEKMKSNEYDMIILDEINNVISYDLLMLEDVLESLRCKPDGLHIVLTGRGAPPEIIEIADLVTEMKEIKHPFQQGIKGQKGVEF